MQESRAQRDISVSKQRLTQSRSVGLSISDAVGAHRFPTDWRLTVRRVGREKRASLIARAMARQVRCGHGRWSRTTHTRFRSTSENGPSGGGADGLLSAQKQPFLRRLPRAVKQSASVASRPSGCLMGARITPISGLKCATFPRLHGARSPEGGILSVCPV
jgi:hypothetical protein